MMAGEGKQRHPAKGESTVALSVGRASMGGDFTVIFVRHHWQLGDDKDLMFARTWSWYLGLHKPDETVDMYALYAELPKLLKRPGQLFFKADTGVDAWIRGELQAKTVVGLIFRDDHKGLLTWEP